MERGLERTEFRASGNGTKPRRLAIQSAQAVPPPPLRLLRPLRSLRSGCWLLAALEHWSANMTLLLPVSAT
jgi:hypothetical protein